MPEGCFLLVHLVAVSRLKTENKRKGLREFVYFEYEVWGGEGGTEARGTWNNKVKRS